MVFIDEWTSFHVEVFLVMHQTLVCRARKGWIKKSSCHFLLRLQNISSVIRRLGRIHHRRQHANIKSLGKCLLSVNEIDHPKIPYSCFNFIIIWVNFDYDYDYDFDYDYSTCLVLISNHRQLISWNVTNGKIVVFAHDEPWANRKIYSHWMCTTKCRSSEFFSFVFFIRLGSGVKDWIFHIHIIGVMLSYESNSWRIIIETKNLNIRENTSHWTSTSVWVL